MRGKKTPRSCDLKSGTEGFCRRNGRKKVETKSFGPGWHLYEGNEELYQDQNPDKEYNKELTVINIAPYPHLGTDSDGKLYYKKNWFPSLRSSFYRDGCLQW